MSWEEIHKWYLEGVPLGRRESVIGLQEQMITGLENELKGDGNPVVEPDLKNGTKTEMEDASPSDRPRLQFYRETFASFYEDIPNPEVAAIFEAEERMANSNLIIGQQIYRVKAILAVYGQRKFLEWLKGICCKICNISWRKAYDLLYAYESRRYVESNQPELLQIFDFQIQRFQCEARRHISNLVPVLEEAKENKKRYTLEEVKELFPSEKNKSTDEPYISELRMSLKKLLDDSLVIDLSRYIQSHPGETFQSVIDSALRTWLRGHDV
ncbi:MAG: hypothetical protein HQM13_14860 [SAR324 cluster bacterium]|nr:hypothetical protein [SAR324 cluster bacterium]